MLRESRCTIWVAILAWLTLAGCDAQLGEGRKGPMTPTGMAPVGQGPLETTPAHPAPAPVQPAPVAPATPAPAAPTPEAAAVPPAAPPAENKGIINKVTSTVVDASEAKKDPRIRETENKIEGFDPFTQAAHAYVALRSKPQVLAFQAALRQVKEGEGRTPTFEEFQQMMRQHRIEFTELYPWQMYGYDPTTGQIVTLENTEIKAKFNQ